MLILSGLNAQSQAPRPEFEAAAIKPYTPGAREIMIRPVDSDRYDITAKAEVGSSAEDQLQLVTQRLPEDRFALVVRRETKEMPVYALLAGKMFLGKNGPKIPEAKTPGCAAFDPNAKWPPATPPCWVFRMGPNHVEGWKIDMPLFVGALSDIVGRRAPEPILVIDHAGKTSGN
jgi:uncharacterized protein (TIGR03435 family)